LDYHSGAYGLPIHEYPTLLKVCDHDGPLFDNPDHRDSIATATTTEDHYYYQRAVSTVQATLGEILEKGVIDTSKPAHVEDCMYTMTPDEDFVVDAWTMVQGEWCTPSSQSPSPTTTGTPAAAAAGPRLVLGAGFSGHGFKLAPLIGDALASLALGKGPPPGIDLGPLSASRFLVSS
jgi:sarcosine oxidase / L-pipecolate oxidase